MKKAAEFAKQPGWFQPDQYSNLANPAAHYLTTGPEIWEQTEGKVTHFVATTGTCGTLTGVSRYLRPKGVKILAVTPEDGHDIPGLRSRKQLKLTDHFHEDEYDQVIVGNNKDAYSWCKFANQKESLCCGPSSGLGLSGVLKGVPDEPGNVAVVIFCDQVFKYADNVKKHCPEVFSGAPQAAPAAPVQDEMFNLCKQFLNSDPATTIPVEHAQKHIQEVEPMIVDCRPLVQWNDKVHVKGAISLPIDQIKQGKVADVLPSKDARILLVCNAGNMSAQSALMLKAMGYTGVRHMMGGTNGWEALGLPTDPPAKSTAA